MKKALRLKCSQSQYNYIAFGKFVNCGFGLFSAAAAASVDVVVHSFEKAFTAYAKILCA